MVDKYEPLYIIRDIFDPSKLYGNIELSSNPSPGAIYFLENNFTNIDWYSLSTNNGAFDILETNSLNIDYHALCSNHSEKAIILLEEYIKKLLPISMYSKINWRTLAENPYAINIIEKNLDYLLHKNSWQFLSKNDKALHILEANMDKICYRYLAENSEIMTFLKKNPDKWDEIKKYNDVLSANPYANDLFKNGQLEIDWKNLSYNTSQRAFELMEKNLDKVYWEGLLYNHSPDAMYILEKYIHLIDKNFFNKNIYSGFSCKVLKNPYIFKPNYEYLKKRMDIIREELQNHVLLL
jgi:hypothetical protein